MSQPAYLAIMPELLARLRGGLVVSCQAEADEPLHGRIFMAAMALAAAKAGALGIRANGPDDITAIHHFVSLPIIGIYKQDYPGFPVRITPTIDSALQVAKAGADVIALDATTRPHPDGLSLAERLRLIHDQAGCPVMADVSSYSEGLAAEKAGADLVATTLAGYTVDTLAQNGPDLELVQQLAVALHIPVVAEGRIATPEQAARALEMGAYAVVVGSAITRPQWITARFVERMAAR